jgi:hypothetical protein
MKLEKLLGMPHRCVKTELKLDDNPRLGMSRQRLECARLTAAFPGARLLQSLINDTCERGAQARALQTLARVLELFPATRGSLPLRRFLKSQSLVWLALAFLTSGSCLADILGEVTRQQPGVTRRHSSGLFDPESNADAYHLAPGECRTLAELEGPGEIRHLWFTIAGDRRYPRALVMRLYWDDADVPSVETPIGDFFAAGNGMRATVTTTPIEVTSYGRALNSYWRMPFRRKARLEMVNESSNRLTVYCQMDWVQLPSLPDDTLYFHARYHQELPAMPFSPYTIFEGEGEGQYVGTVLSSQNALSSWFGEADDRFYIDGEEQPSIVGTGTEDYFTDAWNLRLFTNPNAGVTICEPKGVDCRMTLYRWHLRPPVIFHKSLKVEIERRSFIETLDPQTGARTEHDFEFRPDYFSSVAFWYQKGVAKPFSTLPPLAGRINPETWIEVKEMTNQLACSPGLKPVKRSNRTCHGKTMLFVANDREGAWLETPFNVREPGQYSLSIFQVLTRENGIWKVTLLGASTNQVLDPTLDCYDSLLALKENWPESQVYGTVREQKLGVVTLTPGDYKLRFECVGANPLSRVKGTLKPGFNLAMDAISVRKLPWDNMDQWLADYFEKKKVWERENVERAQQTITTLADAVKRFAQDIGKHPEKLEDLLAKPARLTAASGRWPYLEGKRLPLDPWNQSYGYANPGKFNPDSFDVFSFHGNTRNPSTWIGNWRAPYVMQGGIEGESLLVATRSDGVSAIVQKISINSIPPISGGRQLFLRMPGEKAFATLALPQSLRPGKYAATLVAVTSRDYGIVRWSINGQPLGEPLDGYTPTIGCRTLQSAPVTLRDGMNELRVDVTGRNPKSQGWHAGLDVMLLKAVTP